MKEQINLLKVDHVSSGKEKELARKAKVASFLILIVYCLIVAGSLSFWLILRKQNEQLLAKIEFQEKRIKELESVESQQTFLKQRLSNLLPLLTEEKADYKAIMDKVQSFISEGIVLNQFNVTRDGDLDCGGMASNAVVFGTFIESLLADENLADKVKLSSASRQEDGTYTFSFFLDVKI
jgi:hypothetical protein